MTPPDLQLQGIQGEPAPGPYLQGRGKRLTRAKGHSQPLGLSSKGAWRMPLGQDLILGFWGAKEETGSLQRVEALLSHLQLKQATPFLSPARWLSGTLCICANTSLASKVLSAPGPALEGHLLHLLPSLCYLSFSDPLSPTPGPGAELTLLWQVT